MTYTFTVDFDPEHSEAWSVFIDSGKGSSAEVAARIMYNDVAEAICAALNAKSQAEIRTLFGIPD